MAYNARRTEHSGAKRGKGAYWGRKRDAKPESNRRRREADKKAADELDDVAKIKLGRLLKDGTSRNLHHEIDTGPVVGREAW